MWLKLGPYMGWAFGLVAMLFLRLSSNIFAPSVLPSLDIRPPLHLVPTAGAGEEFTCAWSTHRHLYIYIAIDQ